MIPSTRLASEHTWRNFTATRNYGLRSLKLRVPHSSIAKPYIQNYFQIQFGVFSQSHRTRFHYTHYQNTLMLRLYY
jgi:hypothetical protein